MQCIKTRTEWLKRIISALTGTCISGDAVPFISKNCKKKLQLRVLFRDIFTVPFLGPVFGWTAMCREVRCGNLAVIGSNDLPLGREFDGKFLKKMSNPHTMPCLPPHRLNIDRRIKLNFPLIFLKFVMMILITIVIVIVVIVIIRYH